MLELEIGLVDKGELILDKSFLQFDVRKKIYAKSYFKENFQFHLKC